MARPPRTDLWGALHPKTTLCTPAAPLSPLQACTSHATGAPPLPSSLHPGLPLTPLHNLQDPLPWSVCPLNGNRTGYDEECEKASSTQYFWYRKTLNISPSIQESGAVQWEPALCLVLAWMMVYLCILRGPETTGKVGRRGGQREQHCCPPWAAPGSTPRRRV